MACPRTSFPGTLPGPKTCHSVPLRCSRLPCAPQEGTPRRRLCAPRSGAAQGLGARPQLPSGTWSPRASVSWNRLVPVPTDPPPPLISSPGAAEPGLASSAFSLPSPVSVSKPALSQISRFQPSVGPLPFLPLLPLLGLNLTPVAPKTGFVPKLLHQI